MAGHPPPPARDIYVEYDISQLVREAMAGNPKDLTVVLVPRGLFGANGEPLPVPEETQGTVGSVRIEAALRHKQRKGHGYKYGNADPGVATLLSSWSGYRDRCVPLIALYGCFCGVKVEVHPALSAMAGCFGEMHRDAGLSGARTD
jgi:hypothetical protein